MISTSTPAPTPALRLASRAARLYLGSLRVTPPHFFPERGVIALWHADLALAMRAFAHRGIHVLLSSSRDGEIAALTAENLGYRVVRGSSTRGGMAGLRALLRAARRNPAPLGMALDGPRGPKEKIKPGALWLARELDLPLWPLGGWADHAWRLGSWDEALLPWPWLGRGYLALGPACPPGASADELALAMRLAGEKAKSLGLPGLG